MKHLSTSFTREVVLSDLLQSKRRVSMKYALNIYTASGQAIPLKLTEPNRFAIHRTSFRKKATEQS